MHKYIFPGGLIPSVRAIEDVCRAHTRLRVTTLRGFGQHYAADAAAVAGAVRRQRAPRSAALGFDETFRRIWDFYLAYCEAGFAHRLPRRAPARPGAGRHDRVAIDR